MATRNGKIVLVQEGSNKTITLNITQEIGSNIDFVFKIKSNNLSEIQETVNGTVTEYIVEIISTKNGQNIGYTVTNKSIQVGIIDTQVMNGIIKIPFGQNMQSTELDHFVELEQMESKAKIRINIHQLKAFMVKSECNFSIHNHSDSSPLASLNCYIVGDNGVEIRLLSNQTMLSLPPNGEHRISEITEYHTYDSFKIEKIVFDYNSAMSNMNYINLLLNFKLNSTDEKPLIIEVGQTGNFHEFAISPPITLNGANNIILLTDEGMNGIIVN